MNDFFLDWSLAWWVILIKRIKYYIWCPDHLLSSTDEMGFSTSMNTLGPEQNGRQMSDDIFNSIFMNENLWISHKISLKFIPKVRINHIPALVEIMAWCRSGDKPWYELVMVNLLTHICVTRPRWVKISLLRMLTVLTLSNNVFIYNV